MALENQIQEKLALDGLKRMSSSSGCISSGIAFRAKSGKEIFVKTNSKPGANIMFMGEFASLEAIYKTQIITCPKPLAFLENVPGAGSGIVMEFLDLTNSCDEAVLGHKLALLHSHNWKLIDEQHPDAILKFGFDIPTCCGFLPQKNQWRETWVQFFCEKIDHQLEMLKDSEALSLWAQVRPHIARLFEDLDIKPSLLHGDLWSGNASATAGGPVIYDPASFYGHNEYEMGIATIFGGFGQKFFKSYFSVIPKQAGHNRRIELYQMFHYLNHWNHFGSSYRSQSVSLLSSFVKELTA